MTDAKDMLYTARLFEAQSVKQMTIWTPDGWKAPKGFPRRELLCKPTTGGNAWRVSVPRLIAWLEKNL